MRNKGDKAKENTYDNRGLTHSRARQIKQNTGVAIFTAIYAVLVVSMLFWGCSVQDAEDAVSNGKMTIGKSVIDVSTETAVLGETGQDDEDDESDNGEPNKEDDREETGDVKSNIHTDLNADGNTGRNDSSGKSPRNTYVKNSDDVSGTDSTAADTIDTTGITDAADTADTADVIGDINVKHVNGRAGDTGDSGYLIGNIQAAINRAAETANQNRRKDIEKDVIMKEKELYKAREERNREELETKEKQQTALNIDLANARKYIEEKDPCFIFLGDSRFVGMNASVPPSRSDIFISKGSMGYDWFHEQMQGAEFGDEDILIIGFGINDIANINKYIAYINSINAKHIYWLTVNPVDEEKQRRSRWPITNKEISDFNDKMIASASNYKVIDTYTALMIHGFGTFDGAHYDAATYNFLHDYIISEVTKDLAKEAGEEPAKGSVLEYEGGTSKGRAWGEAWEARQRGEAVIGSGATGINVTGNNIAGSQGLENYGGLTDPTGQGEVSIQDGELDEEDESQGEAGINQYENDTYQYGNDTYQYGNDDTDEIDEMITDGAEDAYSGNAFEENTGDMQPEIGPGIGIETKEGMITQETVPAP